MADTNTEARLLTDRVAEEVRAMMGRRRLSGAELARRLKVSQMWVSYRLSGAQPIDLNDLERIAAALGVRPIDLLPASDRAPTGPYPARPFAGAPQRPPGRSDPTRPVRATRPINPRGLRRPLAPLPA